MSNDQIEELITRRRRQILVHSIIYYKMDDNIVPDSKWAEWALELDKLQREYPDIAAKCIYSEAFSEFDPSSGYNLPLDDPWGVSKAKQLLFIKNKERRI